MANKPQPTQRVLTKKHLARLERERIQQRYLVIGTIVIAVLVLAVIAYGILDQSVFKAAKPVAKVGSTNISTSEFQKQVRFDRFRLIDQLSAMTANPMYLQFFGSYIQQMYTQLISPQQMGQQTIDTLTEDILVEQEAKKLGITVSQAELDKAVQEAFGYFANGTPTPTITPTTFPTETLSAQQMTLLPPTSTPNATATSIAATATEAAAQAAATATAKVLEATASPTVGPTNTPTTEPTATATEAPTSAATASPTPGASPTITQTATPYTQQAYQKTFDDYVAKVKPLGFSKDDLRSMIRHQLLRQKVYDALTKDVPTSAEQIWARHILVATEDEAKKVIDRLNKGEKFDDLAKELSTDTSSKEQGGNLGWFGKGKMVKPFEDAAFSMKVGEISQPVKSDFGYHVIQVLGHEKSRPLTPDEVTQAKQKAYQDWLDGAKKAANIQTYDWASVVPTDPEIPAELASTMSQLQQQQQAQPDLQTLPTNP